MKLALLLVATPLGLYAAVMLGAALAAALYCYGIGRVATDIFRGP